MIVRLRYVQQFKDRYGKLRLYFRRPGCKRVALPPQDDPTFHDVYAAALRDSAPVTKISRVAEGGIEELARSYLASAAFRTKLGPSTQKVYRRIIDDLVRTKGDKPVKLLEPRHVQAMMEAKADTPAAANHLLRTMRALMKHAVKAKMIQTDPSRDVERLKEKGEGAETWSEQDIAAFENRWPAGSRPRLALALLLYTGQRRSDVVRMGRQHVRDGAIDVRQVKTGTRLLIPLHPDLPIYWRARRIASPSSSRMRINPARSPPTASTCGFANGCALRGYQTDEAPTGCGKPPLAGWPRQAARPIRLPL